MKLEMKFTEMRKYCTVGWVDIRTVARVPLRFAVYMYLKKRRGNGIKLVWSSNHFTVGQGHTAQCTI
jgi:hypothetical protein